MRKTTAGLLLGFSLAMGLGFTFSSPGDNGFTTGETITATIMNEIRTFFLRFDSSIVFVETPVTAATIEAAVAAACVTDGNRLESCKEVIIPAGAHSITGTVFFTGDGSAPSADTAEGIWGLKLRGSGSGYLRGGPTVGSDEEECGTTLVWNGSSSAPMFHFHGVRRSVVSDLCFVMDGGQDGTNAASDAILVTATNADAEVSQGLRLSNIDVWGFSDTWAESNSYVSTCIRLAPSDYSGDPPYATDAQIDNFLVENSRLSCDYGFVGANGNTNGIFFTNVVMQHGIVAFDIEDTDLHVLGGYSNNPIRYSGTGDEATACGNAISWLRVGSTSAEQPKNVSVVGHNLEIDCGQAVLTVDAADSANQRDTATSFVGSTINVGAAGVDHAIEYTHFGSFSMHGSTIGIRNGEDYTTGWVSATNTTRSFFAFEPVTASTQKTLRVMLDAANLDDWDSGSFRVARNSFVDLIGTDEIADGLVTAAKIATGALTAADAAADLATQAELDAKSAASSTDNAVPKFDSTAGDVQNSGVLIDDSNNVTIPGSLTTGGSEVPTCLILRNRANTGYVACDVNGTTFTCEVDTNGICNDAT